MNLPFSSACERNKEPILEVLEKELASGESVLEIGSGTGQHAVFFANHLRSIRWIASDRKDYITSLKARFQQEPCNNLEGPFELDVFSNDWDQIAQQVDVVYTANTFHIMPWSGVERFFVISHALRAHKLLVYGPFHYHGHATSTSNENFDQRLREQDVHQGIRDVDDVKMLAETNGYWLTGDFEMPANNRVLRFER